MATKRLKRRHSLERKPSRLEAGSDLGSGEGRPVPPRPAGCGAEARKAARARQAIRGRSPGGIRDVPDEQGGVGGPRVARHDRFLRSLWVCQRPLVSLTLPLPPLPPQELRRPPARPPPLGLSPASAQPQRPAQRGRSAAPAWTHGPGAGAGAGPARPADRGNPEDRSVAVRRLCEIRVWRVLECDGIWGGGGGGQCIIKNGGVKPNIIPSYSELIYYFRAPSMKELQVLTKKAEDCFRAAALASGCTVEIKSGAHDYYNVLPNKSLWKAYMENGRKLGIEFISEDTMLNGPSGSTDFGNVTFVVPGIHPYFHIGSNALNHTEQYTEAAGSQEAQFYTLRTAKALAMTALDVIFKPELLERIREDFKLKLQEEQFVNAVE
ncbi:hypothetical protein H8959_010183 [Pygathrix nigripes]